MAIPEEAIRLQLDRLLESRTFANAERLRAFLRFVVQETLAGRKEGIKEYSIGREVCGRPASFDPKADPIVRVDANRLRSRLDAYYETEGARDEIRIHLPKGAYVPSFERSAAPVEQPPAQASLAVLPFVNLSPPGEHDYFADSLTDELIHALASLEGLHVIARSSVFQFRGRPEDGRTIGGILKVDHVLEGSVRLAGARLRITAQLIDVAHGWLLWSEKFECPWTSVFAVQDEITASITDALRVRLSSEGGTDLFTHVTEDPEAYADYLRGRYFSMQRSPEALTRSIRCHEQALSRDPQCAPAYAGIADSLLVMAINDQEPTAGLMLRARAAANKALEIRPNCPDALVSLGCVKSIFDWDWEGGARDLEEAARRRPGFAGAHGAYAIFNLQSRGKWTEAIDRMQMALRLDPVSHLLWRDMGLIHFMRRSWAEAEQAWRQAEELSPGYRGCLYWRARMAIERGRFDEAIEALEGRWAADPSNTRVLATIGYAYARSGRRDRAVAVLDSLARHAHAGRVPPLNFAIVWLGLGECEEALSRLEKACEDRAAALYQFAVDPLYDAIRCHPRAEALRLAMGLPITPR